MAKTGRGKVVFIILVLFPVLFPASIVSEEITVEAEVNKTDVYQGGSFIYQIRVIGSDRAAAPALDNLEQFDVTFLGGRVNSSSTITIINNKTIEELHKEYILPYKMVPTELGKLEIPSIAVTVGDKQYKTEPITITAEKPRETEAFKLRASFSKDEVYVGESFLFSLVWYIGDDVNSFDLRIPFLDRKEFRFSDPPLDSTRGSATRLRIPLGGQEITAVRGEDRLDKRQYTTLTIHRVVTPREIGKYYIPKAMVSLVSGSTPFVIPSNELSLEVKPLPEKNRPKDFSGIVGDISITAEAEPREVAVLEPITLTVSLSGGPYLEHFELPDIGELDGFKNEFKLTGGTATAAKSNTGRSVTLSVRPLHPEINAVPPITISYFDPEQERYRRVSSKPIPITVRQEQVMTLEDLEGDRTDEASDEASEIGEQLLDTNYTGPAALRNNSFRVTSYPLHLIFIILGPAAAVVSLFFYQRGKNNRTANMNGVKGTRMDELREKIHNGHFASCGKLYETLISYFCRELSLPPSSSTPDEITAALREKGYSHSTVGNIEKIFNRIQKIRYTGAPEGEAKTEAVNDCYNRTIECLDQLRHDQSLHDATHEEETAEK
jgi:hypothetical protein